MGEVHYKFIEINISNRQIFEEIIGNKAVRIDKQGVFYVSPNDHLLLWPDNPRKITRNRYSIQAKIEVNKLPFGGFSLAKVISTKKLSKVPIISK